MPRITTGVLGFVVCLMAVGVLIMNYQRLTAWEQTEQVLVSWKLTINDWKLATDELEKTTASLVWCNSVVAAYVAAQ